MGSSRVKIPGVNHLIKKWYMKRLPMRVRVASLHDAREIAVCNGPAGFSWSSLDFGSNALQNKDIKIAVSATRE